MTSRLVALCVDGNDPPRLAHLWAGVLGWEIADDGLALLPTDDTVSGSASPRSGSARAARTGCASTTSTSPEDRQQTVTRSLELGPGHIDVGQRPR